MKLLLPLLLLLCLELTLVCIHAEESSSMERNFNVEQVGSVNSNSEWALGQRQYTKYFDNWHEIYPCVCSGLNP